ncbi:MAG: 16S rRNA (uracil(1498)-N(3))-methyltransferase [Gammaproteobacteria bacterium]|jgi:16S rRNA (uracil1498-N3)-methyltransferase|nr:16S rRNA (uracil(1498)-N(3))-methyltransferase [Gammaproteobacteria bacterium]
MVPRIYHPETLAAGLSVTLTNGAATHVGKSLRLVENDELRLFNGDGFDYQGRISQTGRNKIIITIDNCLHTATESPLPITLLQGICRNPRMDILIQKSTELGVHHIIPVSCHRSVVRIGADRTAKKISHWQKIAISACEQCGRAQIPTIDPPCKPAIAFAQHVPTDATKLLLDPAGTHAIETELRPGKPVVLFIGPEGGLTEDEIATATDAGFRRIRLGPRVLRTETAPITALSIIQFLIGGLKTNQVKK